MNLSASVNLAVGWRGGQFLEVTPSPEALPYVPYVLGFCLILLIPLWVWTVKSCGFVVKVIPLVPAACPPACSVSECVHGLLWSPSACSSCCVPLASQLWWQHLGLGLRLLLEVLSCCLNCTSVSNSQQLLIPELGFGKCQIPLRNSSSYFFLIHLHYLILLPSAWQQSCRLWWRFTEPGFEEGYHVCGIRAQGSCRCEWLTLFNAPSSILGRMGEDEVNNNSTALFVV